MEGDGCYITSLKWLAMNDLPEIVATITFFYLFDPCQDCLICWDMFWSLWIQKQSVQYPSH